MSDIVLTIAYSVLADDLDDLQIEDTIRQPKFEILVLVQGQTATKPFELPTHVKRIDLDTIGVAKSRNYAIEHASGQYLLFSDAGTTVFVSEVEALIAEMEKNADIDLLQGRAINEDGQLRKRYLPNGTKLTKFNSARIGTIELMVRCDAVRSNRIGFDENFGAGTDKPIGDEYIFVSDCISSGLKCYASSRVIARHKQESSGISAVPIDVRLECIDRVFGNWAFIIRPVFLLRYWLRRATSQR